MAQIKNFPNNIDEYIYAQDVMKWHRPRTQGVYGAEDNLSVKPLAAPAMAVTVSDGFAWMKDDKGNGCVCWNDNYEQNGVLLNLTVEASSATQNRIDRVVVSWETAGYIERPEIVILKGTPSSSPMPPALTNNGATRQISLAKILVPAGASSITADMITDERLDASVCGIVTETVGIDTSVIQSQFDALLLVYQGAIQSSIEGSIPPHAFTHGKDGTDPLTPAEIGAVAEMAEFTDSGAVAITLLENRRYNLSNVSSLFMDVSNVKARGFIKFGANISTPNVTATAKAGDDITKAKAREKWEFDTEDGFVIFKNWGVV
ncbi:MAG: hypothetical protein J6Q10_00470 [Clostridia bacterium]|nr:hypothetical protein [Clostridia bacterium]